jgi:hypothetical protein
MALYAVFVTYRMMGKNYDAAVLAASSQSLRLISAMARNSDRLTLPSTDTARSNTRYRSRVSP